MLWRSPLTKDALEQSISYYSLISDAPTGLGWVYISAGIIALGSAGGRMMKDWKGRHGEVIFDGGSLCTVATKYNADAVVLLSAIAYNQVTELFPSESYSTVVC